MVLGEVIHTDRPNPALCIQFFHRPPCAEYIVIGLVNHIKIKVVQSQLLHRLCEPALCALIADVWYPQLGSDKQFLSGNPAATDRPTNRLFITIGGCGINQTIARLNCLNDSIFTNSLIRHAEHAIADFGMVTPLFSVTIFSLITVPPYAFAKIIQAINLPLTYMKLVYTSFFRNPAPLLLKLSRYLEEDADFYRTLVRANGSEIFMEKLKKAFTSYMLNSSDIPEDMRHSKWSASACAISRAAS